ncbi:MAG TPA: tRNA (guanosine(37)-N1)-methyltransferase TrmD, partial [Desulfobulbaceae bacterium]|nr:tRNA (guanosine(37)-N1)-methyltransferase TrmD [Desulfobulbaceae bacterium]
GVLGCSESVTNDTFSHGLLKHPQYTRPRIFENCEVPAELLTGNHAEIAAFRLSQSVRLTIERRPELLAGVTFTDKERKVLSRVGLLDDVLRLQNT